MLRLPIRNLQGSLKYGCALDSEMKWGTEQELSLSLTLPVEDGHSGRGNVD